MDTVEAESEWVKAPMWEEWLALTRLQWSGRIAFENEVERWANRRFSGKEAVSVVIDDCGGRYEASLASHVATLGDHRLFCGLILLRSWALLESHARLVGHIARTRDWAGASGGFDRDRLDAIYGEKLQGGPVAWLNATMDAVQQPWAAVYGGQAGLVEIALLRNAIAHGHRTVTARLMTEMAGASIPYSATIGAPLAIDFAALHEYRGRIRSWCRVTWDGIVHAARGTHRKDRVAD